MYILCTPSWRFVMATIQKMHRAKGNVYRVLIRTHTLSTISNTSSLVVGGLHF